MKRLTKCKLCAGTGFLTLRKSWIVADGYRREKCHCCHGERVTSHQASSEWIAGQNQLRKDAEMLKARQIAAQGDLP